MNKREPIAWMVYTVDGQSAYVTDNPTDLKEGQSAYALYPGPFEQVLLTEEEIERIGMTHQSLRQVVRAAEKASWEKNHG
jgi:hypothetical protein